MKKAVTKISDIQNMVKGKGMRMDFFLSSIGMSRTHFYFVKKGERVLSDEYKKKINALIGANL